MSHQAMPTNSRKYPLMLVFLQHSQEQHMAKELRVER